MVAAGDTATVGRGSTTVAAIVPLGGDRTIARLAL
jgi:hypothetical protein